MKTIFLGSFLCLSQVFISKAAKPDDRPKECRKIEAVTDTRDNSFQTNIFANASHEVVVILTNPEQKALELEIKDPKGIVLYETTLLGHSIRRKYQTQNLEPGEYLFTISKGEECVAKTIVIK